MVNYANWANWLLRATVIMPITRLENSIGCERSPDVASIREATHVAVWLPFLKDFYIMTLANWIKI